MKSDKITLEVIDWELLDYGCALDRQKRYVESRINGETSDRLVMVEHPPVVTLGKSGKDVDLCLSESMLKEKGVGLFFIERGGRATCHSPGQLVLYPIIELKKQDLQWYVETLLKGVGNVLTTYGLAPEYKKGIPGIWVGGKKIASIGISIKQWVTYHGIALNIDNDLSLFNWIIPCGHPEEIMTSMAIEAGIRVDKAELKKRLVEELAARFNYRPKYPSRRPDWLTLPSPQTDAGEKMVQLLHDMRLKTVCQSAHCPNIGECFGRGTATFLILGNQCTRNCRFCAIETAQPGPPDQDEPLRVANTVEKLGLRYVVITSVTRDDLPDGGASQFVKTIEAIRIKCPSTRIEILVPDFKGIPDALRLVCDANPDMFNHNIETVPRLYSIVRPQAIFERSLRVLKYALSAGLPVKSGLMLGLGETEIEITDTLFELRNAGCDFLTIGQYLSPSAYHLPVARYVQPDEFVSWAEKAKYMGFRDVASGPLVRSSYMAEKMFSGNRPEPQKLHLLSGSKLRRRFTFEEEYGVVNRSMQSEETLIRSAIDV